MGDAGPRARPLPRIPRTAVRTDLGQSLRLEQPARRQATRADEVETEILHIRLLPEPAEDPIFLDVCMSGGTVARLRRPWFRNEPVDGTFFSSAAVALSDTFEIARSAEDVWSQLTADGALWWCRILDDVTWTSPRPFGVGTTRTVSSLKGLNVIQEHFFRWEEGRRKSFYVVAASAPLFKRFAEDYLVEPVSESACRFTWTIAYEPRAAVRPGRPLNDRLLRTLFTDSRRHFDSP
jgi:hypothetical protein